MTRHDLESMEREQHDRLVHPAGGSVSQYRPNDPQAREQIEQILKGHGDAHQLPQLVSLLDDDGRADYAKAFGRFENVPGDKAGKAKQA